jgi:hypothetical protein
MMQQIDKSLKFWNDQKSITKAFSLREYYLCKHKVLYHLMSIIALKQEITIDQMLWSCGHDVADSINK